MAAVGAVLLSAGQSGAAPAGVPAAVRAAPASASVSASMVTRPAVNGLRVRSRGSFSGYIKGQLYRGDKVRVVGWHGPWVEVQLTHRSAGGLRGGALGWSYRGYVYKPHVCPRSSYVCKHW